MSKKIIFFAIFYISVFFYTTTTISAAQPSDAVTQASLQQQYKELQQQLSPLLQQWHPITIEREKYTISPVGIIVRLLLGGIMAGPALAANYINQYVTKEEYKGQINTLTLLLAAASAAPAIRNLMSKTGMTIYDTFTYPDVEAIKAKNKAVEEKIYKIDDDLVSLELELFSLTDYSIRDQIYREITDLFKKPQAYSDILTFKNTQKENIKKILEKYKNYTPEKLRFLLQRKKASLIIYIKKTQASSLYLKTDNLGTAIIGTIILLPWILLGGLSGSSQPPSIMTKNQEIALIDTILTALATYP